MRGQGLNNALQETASRSHKCQLTEYIYIALSDLVFTVNVFFIQKQKKKRKREKQTKSEFPSWQLSSDGRARINQKVYGSNLV